MKLCTQSLVQTHTHAYVHKDTYVLLQYMHAAEMEMPLWVNSMQRNTIPSKHDISVNNVSKRSL